MEKEIFIIAEAGVNHNGSLERALKLIDAAVEAGVDAVKFQTFKTEKLVCRHAAKAAYQQQSTSADETQYAMLKKLELDEKTHKELLRYCQSRNIKFLSTPFDLDSVELLAGLGLRLFKVPSGEITNLPYLRKIGSLHSRVILSTGMADLQEIGEALNILLQAGTQKDDIVILHCNTEYPTPLEDVNLRAMRTIGDRFGVRVGYSDHTLGIEVSVAAAALGAVIIEKHFTLDRTLPGPDHGASLEPHELKQLVQAVRNVSKALGSPEKKPSLSELQNREVVRKSIVAGKPIAKGDVFTEENLGVKRPGNGLSPTMWDTVLGQIACRDFSEDEMIELGS
jgi:N,N'-diacetyllegionaminate synthase